MGRWILPIIMWSFIIMASDGGGDGAKPVHVKSYYRSK